MSHRLALQYVEIDVPTFIPTQILLHLDDINSPPVVIDSNNVGLSHTWTASGNATISAGTSVFGGASLLLDGTGDYSTTTDSDDFSLGDDDFTIDCWFNCTATTGTFEDMAGQRDAGLTASLSSWSFARTDGNFMRFEWFIGSSSFSLIGTTQFTSVLNTGWHHMAVVRSGSTVMLFIDGAMEDSDAISGSINDSSEPMGVGTNGGHTGNPWTGSIDEFRFSSGFARWTSEFTVPSEADPETTTFRFASDTRYLPNDIDAIPSIRTVVVNPAIISLGQNLGQRASVTVTLRDHKHIFVGEDFDAGTFWGKWRARYGLKLQGRELRLIQGFLGQELDGMETRTFTIESTDGPSTKGEFKIVAKDLFKFADGERAQAPRPSSGFLQANILAAATSLTLSPTGIGDDEYPTSGYLNIGGNEVVAFTRAYGEPANDSFVRVYLAMTTSGDSPVSFADTNAGGTAKDWIIDGNATVSSESSSPYGGFAGVFDGSGDWARINDEANFTLGSSDWAVDFWFNRLGDTGVNSLFGQTNSTGTAATTSIWGGISAGNLPLLSFSNGAAVTQITSASTITDSNWHHWFACRDSGTIRLHIDGVQVASGAAVTIQDSSNQWRVGNAGELATTSWQGRMQHFRLSVGTSRHSGGTTFDPADDYPPGVTTTGDSVTITRAQYNTTAQDHDAQSRAQVCLEFLAQDVAQIINDLMVDYADVDQDLIPLSTWLDETDEFLNTVYSALITEPTAVNKLISELVEQAGLAVWWDDLAATFRLQVLRAISTASQTYTPEEIMANTLDVKEQPSKRLSQVYVYFDKINPLINDDQINNYRSTSFDRDLEAEAEYGAVAIKKIFSRWIATGGRAVADAVIEILLSRFRDPPRRINFELFRDESGNTPTLGGGYQIESWPFQDTDGTDVAVPIQLTSVNPMPDRFEIEAEEMLFIAGAATSPDNHVIIFDSSVNNVNLRDVHDNIYDTPVSGDTVTCTIAAGVIIGSTTTGTSAEQAAFYVGDWPAGVTINIIVLGRIQGKGATGGNGGFATFGSFSNGVAGGAGGTALYTRETITLNAELGQLWGGGGGGGGGAGRTDFSSEAKGGSGAGGGAGTNVGSGGTGGFGSGDGSGNGVGGNGTAGTATTGGVSGSASGCLSGGSGGGPGIAGNTGSSESGAGGFSGGSGGAGGAAGRSVDGISFVSLSSPAGDFRGSQVN